MDKPRTFLDVSQSPFSHRVIRAAQSGALENTKPLLDHLARAQAIARGVAVVANMHGANAAQKDAYEDRKKGEAIEPPLSESSMSALLDLVKAACDGLASDIDHLATWTEECAMPSPKAPPLKVANGKHRDECMAAPLRNGEMSHV